MRQMFVDGEWVQSNALDIGQILNPATEEVLDQVPAADEVDTDRAAGAAARALNDWRWIPGLERIEMLHEAARKLRDNFDSGGLINLWLSGASWRPWRR